MNLSIENKFDCGATKEDKFFDDTDILADGKKHKRNNMKYEITVKVCETGEVKKRWFSNTVPKEETAVSSEIETSEEFKAFSDMRKKAKRPLTDRAAKMIISKLKELAPHDYEMQKKILNQSTMNGWRGVFPLHEEKQSKSEKDRVGGTPSLDIHQVQLDAMKNTEIKGL